MRHLRMVLPLVFLAGTACSSSNPAVPGGSGGSGGSSSSSSGSSGGSGPMTDGGLPEDGSAPDSGPVPGGPPQVIIAPRTTSNFGRRVGLSHDGKVLMVSALTAGELGAPDEDRMPVFAFARNESTFASTCQLPDLKEKQLGRQGDMLALNNDGAVLVMDETIGDGSIYVTGYHSKDGCWERTGFQKDIILAFSSLNAIGVSGDGATVIAGRARDTSNSQKQDSDTFMAGSLAVWSPSGDASYRAPLVRPNSGFGISAAISGNGSLAFVGEPQNGAPKASYPPGEPRYHGSAYVLDLKNQGAALATLNAANWAEGAGYGRSIAASADGHHILVGAEYESSLDETGTQMVSNGDSGSGAVYLFEGDGTTWTQRHMFKPESPKDVGGGSFGRSVAISDDGNTVVVGASWYKPELSGGLESGAIYIFKRGPGDTWTHRVLDGATYPLTSFATSFALDGSGKLLVVGAPAWSIKEAGVVKSTGVVLAYSL